MNLTPEADLAPQTPRVSVVVVTFNRCETLRRALEMLGTKHQVIVVDNGSFDGTSSMLELNFPELRLIRLPKNFGLTKALNLGIRAADGTYVLLQHDDTLLSSESADRLANYLGDHPEAGAVSPLLTDEDGNAAPQSRPLPTASVPDSPYLPDASGSAENVLGAAVMYRSFFLRAIRQIDERYGTYGADVELSWQVTKGGKKNAILHEVKAVHLRLSSPVKPGVLAGDRAAGTAAFLGTHVSMSSGLLYRLKTGLAAILAFRMSVITGVFSGQKIDGTN